MRQPLNWVLRQRQKWEIHPICIQLEILQNGHLLHGSRNLMGWISHANPLLQSLSGILHFIWSKMIHPYTTLTLRIARPVPGLFGLALGMGDLIVDNLLFMILSWARTSGELRSASNSVTTMGNVALVVPT